MENNVEGQKPLEQKPGDSEVIVRTMESDAKAVEQGGGEMAAPKPFIVSGTEQAGPKIEAGLGISEYGGPEKPIFSPAPSISALPEQPAKKSSNKKTIIMIAAVLAIVIGFGLLGYFAASRWLFPQQMPEAQ